MKHREALFHKAEEPGAAKRLRPAVHTAGSSALYGRASVIRHDWCGRTVKRAEARAPGARHSCRFNNRHFRAMSRNLCAFIYNDKNPRILNKNFNRRWTQLNADVLLASNDLPRPRCPCALAGLCSRRARRTRRARGGDTRYSRFRLFRFRHHPVNLCPGPKTWLEPMFICVYPDHLRFNCIEPA
jgi:hypothetical protein